MTQLNTNARVLRSYRHVALFLLFTTALWGCKKAESRPCPSMPCPPNRAAIALSPGLSQNGPYTLHIVADDKKETCTVEVTGIAPAQATGGFVMGPTTRTKNSCKLLATGGIASNGAVAFFNTIGTPKTLSVAIHFGGKEIAKGQYKLVYKKQYPFGKHCHACMGARATLKTK